MSFSESEKGEWLRAPLARESETDDTCESEKSQAREGAF
jgi:hypothetical protein